MYPVNLLLQSNLRNEVAFESKGRDAQSAKYAMLSNRSPTLTPSEKYYTQFSLKRTEGYITNSHDAIKEFCAQWQVPNGYF
jgi:hypothetical protein